MVLNQEVKVEPMLCPFETLLIKVMERATGVLGDVGVPDKIHIDNGNKV